METTLKELIFNLENLLLQPDIRSSPEELNKLLAEEFFEYGSSGNVWYKSDFTSNGGLSVVNMKLYDFEIYSLSNNAVLATYKINDETRNQHSLRSSIWKQIDGRWQMFFHQGTVART